MEKAIKHILLAMAAVWVFWACTDDSYRGFEEDYSDYEVPLTVKIAVGDPYVKGSGPVDELADFKNKELLVWAYCRDGQQDFSYVRTATDSLHCLINEREALLDGINSLAQWKGAPVYYPFGEHSGVSFDFWAAYVDDVAIKQIHRSREKVDLEFDIDGSQDLMVSKAALPVIKAGKATKEYAFSYLSAMDGDDPIFTMNHTLVKIDLIVRPGITKNFAQTMEIREAALESRKSARMTAVAADPATLGVQFSDTPKDFLLLTEANGDKLGTHGGVIDYHKIATVAGDPGLTEEKYRAGLLSEDEVAQYLAQTAEITAKTQQLGASFYVAPEKEYKLRMVIEPIEGRSEETPQRGPVMNTVRLTSGEPFLAGHHYIVYMTVYGEYAMITSVQMAAWKDHGSFYLDLDRDTEDIELNIKLESSFTLAQGATLQLQPQILVTGDDGKLTPVDRPDVAFSYESQNPEIAPVSESGLVTALAPGEGTVIVTAHRYVTRPDTGESQVAGVGQVAVQIHVTNE